MTQAKANDTVRIHYTGTLDDGTVFDSSRGREPLEFTLGTGQVIPGFDRAVMGMTVGESKRVVIPPGDAYGDYSDSLLLSVKRAEFPTSIHPEVGMQLAVTNAQGQQLPVVIKSVDAEQVVLDANHPLAGLALTFDLELVSIG